MMVGHDVMRSVRSVAAMVPEILSRLGWWWTGRVFRDRVFYCWNDSLQMILRCNISVFLHILPVWRICFSSGRPAPAVPGFMAAISSTFNRPADQLDRKGLDLMQQLFRTGK